MELQGGIDIDNTMGYTCNRVAKLTDGAMGRMHKECSTPKFLVHVDGAGVPRTHMLKYGQG